MSNWNDRTDFAVWIKVISKFQSATPTIGNSSMSFARTSAKDSLHDTVLSAGQRYTR